MFVSKAGLHWDRSLMVGHSGLGKSGCSERACCWCALRCHWPENTLRLCLCPLSTLSSVVGVASLWTLPFIRLMDAAASAGGVLLWCAYRLGCPMFSSPATGVGRPRFGATREHEAFSALSTSGSFSVCLLKAACPAALAMTQNSIESLRAALVAVLDRCC